MSVEKVLWGEGMGEELMCSVRRLRYRCRHVIRHTAKTMGETEIARNTINCKMKC